jgi:cell division septation protein DedD
VITNFGGETADGSNDGIDLAVPEGTAIRAADDGVVAYAGNELKGYGNLVLIRHANDFVTAYANAQEILVKQNDQVHRGQVIARSGHSGSASTPQFHFEVRKDSAPVDPLQFLPNDLAVAAAPAETLPEPQSAPGENFGKDWVVQLSAHRSEKEAQAALRAMQTKYSVLGGYEPKIRRKDKADRGVFYAAQVGPLARDEANHLCEKLKGAGANCFVQKK